MKKKLIILAFAACAWSMMAVADIQQYTQTTEEAFNPAQKLKAFKEHFQTATFRASDGENIFYYAPGTAEKTQKKALIISPGKGETALKYSEFALDIRLRGYDVFIIEHRGQGHSSWTWNSFGFQFLNTVHDIPPPETFAKDFMQFVKIVKTKNYEKVDVFAHSMGGAIATYALAEYLETVDHLYLSGPMLALNTSLFLKVLMRASSPILNTTPPGKIIYNGGRKPVPLTSSAKRFELVKLVAEENKGMIKKDITLRGLGNLFRLEKLAQDDLKEIKTPITIFIGKADEHMNPKELKSLCSIQPNCMTVEFSAQHELYIEKDSVRNAILDAIAPEGNTKLE